MTRPVPPIFNWIIIISIALHCQKKEQRNIIKTVNTYVARGPWDQCDTKLKSFGDTLTLRLFSFSLAFYEQVH